MPGNQVTIDQYTADPWPGWVTAALVDAAGRMHTFREKAPVIAGADFDASTLLPRIGVIACRVVGRVVHAGGADVVLVDTEGPWGIASIEGVSRFEVLRTQFVGHDD